ncbi:AraC family transcriptional regulator [Agrobacterium sp. LR_9]
MYHSSPDSRAPEILLTSEGRGWNGLAADFVLFPSGISDVPGGEMHGLGMHYGPPVNAHCRCGGRRMRRLQKPGDIDIVPAGVGGTWEDEADAHILSLRIFPWLINQVAKELDRDPSTIELLPQFQVRDARIEGIAWAIKADLESDTPSDPLYIELLANALAVRLIEIGSGNQGSVNGNEQKLSARQLKLLTDFIESNLDQKLHLADLAAVAGVGVTRLKALFRNSTGAPVHQYVIRRRVEYARAMMETTSMPASEIAVAAGFAHQSHMTSTMRRVLGQTPSEITRHSSHFRPKLQTHA